MVEHNINDRHLLDVKSYQEIERIKEKLEETEIFILRDQSGKKMYSNALKRYSEYLLDFQSDIGFFSFPDEVEGDQKFLEGRSKQVHVNVYERNPQARQKCIDHYGYTCRVCEFDFEKTYGEVGKNFIHVHHLIEISSVSEEYEIDPIQDLLPVCPNCHAMIHKKKPAYTIEEVKSFLRK